MNDQIIILNYPESDWGDDLVCFHLPKDCEPIRLLDELDFCRTALSPEHFDSLQDYADALCTQVAQALSGTWNYVAQCGSIEIRYE